MASHWTRAAWVAGLAVMISGLTAASAGEVNFSQVPTGGTSMGNNVRGGAAC